MKKLTGLLALSALIVSAGCSSNADKNGAQGPDQTGTTAKPVTLTVMTNATGTNFDAIQAVVTGFMKENPNIKVDLSSQGKDYEQLMKAKMASNDLPDIFATHGWSVNRYSEYLRPLNDQEWFGRIADTIKPTITDKKGNVFVLPLNIDKSGIVYNKKVLEDLKLDVPVTWDQFFAAAKTIRDAGITPIYLAGKDAGKIAGYYNKVAPGILVTSPNHNEGDALKNGTFDWSKWDAVNQLLVNMKQQGFLNKDVNTADPLNTAEKMATGKAAFLIENNAIIGDVLKINPDAKLGMMPVPAYYDGDQPILNGGEREAFGVNKNSTHITEALKLLQYMAKSENIAKISAATAMPPALKDVEVNLGNLTEDYKKYAQTRVIPVFDREYLPSGMWSTMKITGPGVLTGQISVQQATQMMKADYLKLRSQQ